MSRKFSYLPNALSIIRIAIAPAIFIAIKFHCMVTMSMLAAVAIISDFLDGYLARRLNLVSKSGKILDPLADKFCIAMTALAAMLYLELPLTLLVIILSRDIIITLFGLAIIARKKRIPISNVWGKFTAGVLSVTLLIYVFKIRDLYFAVNFAASVMVLISSVSYLRIGFRALATGGNQPSE